MATIGSMLNMVAVSAERMAISASSSLLGLGLTAQSPYTRTRVSKHMKKTLDTTCTPGRVRMI